MTTNNQSGHQSLNDENGHRQTAPRIVRNGDVEVAVFEHGDRDKETILLLHGWPDSHYVWDRVVPLLVDRFHVVTADNRGHGMSSAPTSREDYTLAKIASDYLAVIDAVSPGRPAHVMAHDWGSAAVWEAICEPEAGRRIASFTSVAGPNADHLMLLLRRRFAHPTLKNLGLALAQAIPLLYQFLFMIPVLPGILVKASLKPARWRTSLALVEKVTPDQIGVGPTLATDASTGLRVYQANVLSALLRPRERFTAVPVQLIVGNQDPVIRASSYEDEPKWTERVWLRVLNGGHWLSFSQPQALATAAIELADLVAGEEPAPALRQAEMRA